MEPLRVCRNCGLTAFTKEDLKNFVKNRECKWGYASECKKCRNKRTIENKGKEKPLKSRHVFINNIESKRCTNCNELLPLTNFYKNKNSWDGLMFRCKECENKYQKTWSKENPEKTRAVYKRYKEKHPDKYRDTQESCLNRRLTFNKKLLRFPEQFRINVCSECGKSYPNELSERTHLHHIKYDEDDPLSNTIELCRSCHAKLHWKLWRKNK